MAKNEELIWVSQELAEKYKKAKSENATRDEQEKVVDDYINSVASQVRKDFKQTLESIEEDAAMFAGLIIKVKQAFGKAKDEHLSASYELWEKYDQEIPSVKKKIDGIVAALNPLKAKLDEINQLLRGMDVTGLNRLNEAVYALNDTYGKSREMFEFLVKNFGEKNNG